jgi:hypothetical protein
MKYIVGIGVALLAVVILGWYCSENFTGRISRRAEMVGDAIIRPGQVVDTLMSGNLHCGFGDWRDAVIKIGASFVAWFLPCVVVLVGRWSQRTSKSGQN